MNPLLRKFGDESVPDTMLFHNSFPQVFIIVEMFDSGLFLPICIHSTFTDLDCYGTKIKLCVVPQILPLNCYCPLLVSVITNKCIIHVDVCGLLELHDLDCNQSMFHFTDILLLTHLSRTRDHCAPMITTLRQGMQSSL